MSDWEVYQQGETQPESDWSVVTPQKNEPRESFGESAMYAIPRVATDIGKGLYNVFQNIPEYMQKAQTEVPARLNLQGSDLFNPGQKIKFGMEPQAMGGLAEHGQNVFNMPHDAVNYLSQRLHLVPENINRQVQMGRMPSDTQKMINDTYGMPNQPGEGLVRGIMRNPLGAGLGIKGTLGLARTGAALATPINARKVSQSIQAAHDNIFNLATSGFSHVAREAKQRNIGSVPLNQNLVADIADHPLMPKTKKMQDVLNRAHSGDYEGLRNLQSEMWTRATKANKSPLVSENIAGEELFDLRDRINQSIFDHLEKSGNPDLAKTLQESMNHYRKLQNTYFSKDTPSHIKKLVHPDTRKMPKNIMKILQEESIPMEKIKMENPLAAGKSVAYEKKQNALKNLKRLGYGTGLGLLGYGAYEKVPAVHDILFGEK